MEEYKRLFKKHYKAAMKLKEGGKAWEREIGLAQHYLELGRKAYKANLKAKYCQ